MANNRMVDKVEEPLNTYVIPENFADTGRCFNGMFRTRNLVEGAILAAPIAYGVSKVNLPMNQKAVLMTLTAGLVFFGCLTGINGDSVSEFFFHIIGYIKKKRIARYNPRVRTEAKPGYLTKENAELPREKIRRLLDSLQSTKEERESVSSEIYDPIYREFFEDDLGYVDTPDALKSRSERRREAKLRKKEAKAKAREEKAAIKEKKKTAKEEMKKAGKNKKHNKKKGA